MGLGAFARDPAGGFGAAGAGGGRVAAFAFSAGAGFTVSLGGFAGLARTTAFAIGLATGFFAVFDVLALRALAAFFDRTGFMDAARGPFVLRALLALLVLPALLVLLALLAFLGLLAFFALRALRAGLRARPGARRARRDTFFLRAARGAAFLAEARRVLDLAMRGVLSAGVG